MSSRTSHAVVRGELGWYRLEARRDLARLRFWGKMVLMSEDRLVKKVYRIRKAAAEAQGKDKKNWCYYTKLLLEQLGLGHVWQSEDIGVSKVVWMSQVKKAIQDREQKEWQLEIQHKPKLRLYSKLKTKLEFELYLDHSNPWSRRLFTMLRGGTNRLRIETGRYKKEPLHQRTCNICLSSNQVEDEAHFLLECGMYKVLRERMFEDIFQITGLNIGLVMENRDWVLDVLLGQGLVDLRPDILKTVMLFVVRASRIRQKYCGDKEVD